MKKGWINLLLIVLFSATVMASIQIQSSQLETNYTLGDIIGGKIILNITNQSADSIVRASSGGDTTLFTLIDKSGLIENQDYFCDVLGCSKTYDASATMGQSALLNDDMKVGFKVIGRDMQILNMNLGVSSDALSSCSNQLGIVLPGSNEFLQNSAYLNASLCGARTSGCFDAAVAGQTKFEIPSGNIGYCNKIHLPSAPAYSVGAKITNTTTGNGVVSLNIYDANVSGINSLGSCNLPKLDSNEQEVSCVMKTTLKEGDYFLCVSALGGNFKIRAESEGSVCGSVGMSDEFSADYEVFAQPLRYSSPFIDLANETRKQTTDRGDIEDYANRYLESHYASNDCSRGCIIPLEIKKLSEGNQNIQLLNPSVRYSANIGLGTNTELYLLDERSAKVSGNQIEVDMSKANFSLSQIGAYAVNLSLGDKSVTVNVNVTAGFSFDLMPKFAYVQIPTTFTISTSQNLSQVVWNFGDGTGEQNGGKTIDHTYSKDGTYNVTVRVSRTGTTIQKTYNIIVGNVAGSVEIVKNRTDLQFLQINNFLNGLPSWIKPSVNNRINLTSLLNQYNSLLNVINTSSNDSVRINAIGQILNLGIPDAVEFGTSENLPLAAGFSSINTKYIENISNTQIDASKRGDLNDALIYWINQNYNPTVERKEIISIIGTQRTVLGEMYGINFNKKTQFSGETYFIIEYPADRLVFSQNQDVKTINEEGVSTTYLLLNNAQKIEFFVPEKAEISSLGMYLGPKVDVLGSFASETQAPVNKLPTGWLIFWIVLLAIAFLVVYIILQEWYKKRYESFLFSNKDDLYNILSFISNSRQEGMADNDIRKKLTSMNWSGEQISYAFKKMDGKRTGMWEIPIFRGREQKKIKEEIDRRKELNTAGGRFIKRPFM